MKRGLSLILALFFVLCVAFNFAVPLFEGADEGAHFKVVDYIATNLRLPDMNQADAISHEVSQPPLYYVASAFVVKWIDRSDLWHVFRVNKDQGAIIHDHTNAETVFPPYGATLAVRLNRLFSSLLGAITLASLFGCARLLFGRDDLALFVTGLTAFNPKFAHMSSIVSNDIATVCMGALAFYWMARLLRQARAPNMREFMILGGLIGLAYLCKPNGLALGLPAAVMIAWLARRNRQGWIKAFVSAGLCCLGGFLLTSGWYLGYCWIMYGNPLAWDQVQQTNAALARVTPLDLGAMIASIPAILSTLWGDFGQGIRWSNALDVLFIGIDVLALCGLVLRVLRRDRWREIGLAGLVVLAAVLAYIPWLRGYAKTENIRLIAPALPAFYLLIAVGLFEWIPARVWSRANRIAAAAAFIGSFAVIPLFLVPAYDVPRYLSLAEEQALPAGGRVAFDNGIELVHASINATRVNPGETLTITAYWRATRLIDHMNLVWIDVRDSDGQSLARTNVTPMRGRINTSQWGSGVLRDDYEVRIPEVALGAPGALQTIARIYFGWYEYDDPTLVAHVLNSTAVSAQVAEVKISGRRVPDSSPGHRIDATFASAIALEGYDIEGDRVRLYWRDVGAPDRDYTVFVHALDAAGAIIGQSDHMPTPPIRFWDAGEQIIDMHDVSGAPNAVRLEIGLYDPATGLRLSAAKQDKTAWPDDIVVIPLK